MSVPEFIKRSLISQFIIMLIFVVSGLIVCSLQTLTIFLWPINKKWYRLLNCYLVYMHWGQVVFLCDYWAEVELHIHATPELWPRVGKEHALMVCNHRNDLDWIVTWMIGDRAGFLQSCKSLVKNESRYIPFIGWSFLFLEFIFVKRDFTKDRESLIKGFQSYGEYPLKCVTLLFCEGTRFTQAKHEKSIEFARKQGIEPLKHHLLPRTKGFTMCIDGFKGNGVPAMYDCCVGYDTVRGAQPTLTNILQGRKQVFHLLGKRVLMEDIPNNTEEECAEYCYNLYKKKDEEYEYFLKHNTFAGLYDGALDHVIPRRQWPLFIEMFWLLILGCPRCFTWLRYSFMVPHGLGCLLLWHVVQFAYWSNSLSKQPSPLKAHHTAITGTKLSGSNNSREVMAESATDRCHRRYQNPHHTLAMIKLLNQSEYNYIMSIPVSIKRSPIAQFILVFVFVVSGLIVCTIQTLTIFIWPFSKDIYRIVNCKLVYLHWAELVFLCDYWAEIELHVTIPEEQWYHVGNEHALLVMNHRCSVDFMITWLIGDRVGILGNCKCLVMNWLRYIPLIGWSFVLLEFIFIGKDSTKNRQNVIKGFATYGNYPLNCVTLLFCEGTRFSDYDHAQSLIHAEKRGIEPFKHHLLPRTKGFAMAVEGLKGSVPAMYDSCIGYDTINGAHPTLENLFQGKKMVFHVTGRRVLIDDIPTTTEKECAEYCYDMYRKKDDEYAYFVKHNTFEGYDKSRVHRILPRRTMPLIIVLCWCLVIVTPSLYIVVLTLLRGSMLQRAFLVLALLTVHITMKVLVWFSHRNLPQKTSNICTQKTTQEKQDIH
ncbi:uncharacterized protein [Amphiura filiformis]|uniref:uncharacterized protein n=1 Tax=Amphiura filiformis TaxID=82378 RepID=UPI003B20BAF4